MRRGTVGSGTWSVSDGVLQQTEQCTSNTDSLLDNQDWTDVEARVDVRFDSICGSGLRQAALLVRVQGVDACVGNRYDGCLNDVDTDFLMAAEWTGECVTYDNKWSPATSLVTGVWYTVVASMIGDTLVCSVSGPGIRPAA